MLVSFGEFFVEFARERERGEVELHRVGGLFGELHVLDVVLDEEAGLEVALEDARAVVGKAPCRGRAAADRFDEFLEAMSNCITAISVFWK